MDFLTEAVKMHLLQNQVAEHDAANQLAQHRGLAEAPKNLAAEFGSDENPGQRQQHRRDGIGVAAFSGGKMG